MSADGEKLKGDHHEEAILITKNIQQVTGKNIRTLRDVTHHLPQITIEQWESVDGIGPKVAESMHEWFHNGENLNVLRKMADHGVQITFSNLRPARNTLQGKAFVLTGELENFTRDAAKDMIRRAGGHVSAGVSAKTDYVVAGADPGSKYDKAKKLGVRIIDEAEFVKITRSSNN